MNRGVPLAPLGPSHKAMLLTVAGAIVVLLCLAWWLKYQELQNKLGDARHQWASIGWIAREAYGLEQALRVQERVLEATNLLVEGSDLRARQQKLEKTLTALVGLHATQSAIYQNLPPRPIDDLLALPFRIQFKVHPSGLGPVLGAIDTAAPVVIINGFDAITEKSSNDGETILSISIEGYGLTRPLSD